MVMRWVCKKATCEQMVFGKRQKRQVVVGKVTATLNGQQMAHPGPGHLHHSANAKEGPLALELGGTPFKSPLQCEFMKSTKPAWG